MEGVGRQFDVQRSGTPCGWTRAHEKFCWLGPVPAASNAKAAYCRYILHRIGATPDPDWDSLAADARDSDRSAAGRRRVDLARSHVGLAASACRAIVVTSVMRTRQEEPCGLQVRRIDFCKPTVDQREGRVDITGTECRSVAPSELQTPQRRPPYPCDGPPAVVRISVLEGNGRARR